MEININLAGHVIPALDILFGNVVHTDPVLAENKHIAIAIYKLDCIGCFKTSCNILCKSFVVRIFHGFDRRIKLIHCLSDPVLRSFYTKSGKQSICSIH